MVGGVQLAVLVMASAALCHASYVQNSILCDDLEAICQEFTDTQQDSNVTKCEENQQQVLNPVTCNCGLMCITNIEEGESCDTSSPAKYPTKLCGPGLECIAKIPYKPETAVCTRNAARKCINETLQYEADQVAGTLGPGRYKPNCDEYGKYAPRQCTPGSTCYCVNENGERLFGEGSISDQDMINCECSVYWENTISKGLELGMRCLPNGNFDPLQCFDNHCFCYDLSTSSVQSGPFSIDMLIFMSCYNSTIHNKDYNNACQKAVVAWDSQGVNDTIIIEEISRPICNPDGYYAAVQYRGPNAYCADIYGNQIENFEQPIYLAENMNCNCARRRYIMEESGFGASKPKCCPDGHYYPWQTRGLMAYCVDENGNQIGEETAVTNIEELSCSSSCDTSLEY